ncbi:unnamed protein product [Zymoseptoria tritici ST99CH_3D7]|uniref:Uncharacterized protein n=1 Tax=Zymoseptoria tritici (strain ST99CH_3D7) TaxID=1276538 RepID=A0A1X7RDI4_ZYMT9|nr:unnamed protein product [Zymoseptoria tritici ST99CH_3D7]
MSDADEPQDGQLGPVIGFMTDSNRVHISLTRATGLPTLTHGSHEPTVSSQIDFTADRPTDLLTLVDVPDQPMASYPLNSSAPSRQEPAESHMHPDITTFALTGQLKLDSGACAPAFETLRRTSAAKEFDVSSLANNNLLASTDFATTVKIPSDPHFVMDEYLNKVRYVLSHHQSGKIDTLLIISQFEAGKLQGIMTQSTNITLHVYIPSSLGGELDSYTVPNHNPALTLPRPLAAQLNLFAGALDIKSYQDYKEICKFLGLDSEAARDGWEIAADGFIVKDGDGRRGGSSGLQKSPVEFFKALCKIRRYGRGIDKSKLGKVLDGHLLWPDDFHR